MTYCRCSLLVICDAYGWWPATQLQENICIYGGGIEQDAPAYLDDLVMFNIILAALLVGFIKVPLIS